MSEIRITINGKQFKADSELSILENATKNGIKIPSLCFTSDSKENQECDICVVQIDENEDLTKSCYTNAADGMVIETENPKIISFRKNILQKIAANHYGDCLPPCTTNCPAGVDVQGYISLIEKELYTDAIELIKEKIPLPSICGRICLRPCEKNCYSIFLEDETSVGINNLKRFAADFDLNSENHYIPKIKDATGKKVAIIGAGPGGLSAAYFLRQKGHNVDIFETKNQAGGWLRYGIPEFKLPNEILEKEILRITEIGIKIYYNKKLGVSLSYSQIEDNYDATILTMGSQKESELFIEGEESEKVFSGIEFLSNKNETEQEFDFSEKTIAVIGNGLSALSCARTAARFKAKKVYMIFSEYEEKVKSYKFEISQAKIEGIEFLFLTNPVKINSKNNNDKATISCVKLQENPSKEFDYEEFIEIEGSEFDIEADYILNSSILKPDYEFINDINENTRAGELKINEKGNINVNPQTLQTGIHSVFAAGDGVFGSSSLIESIAQAKIAAKSCHQYLVSKEIKPQTPEFLSKKSNFKILSKKDFTGKFKSYKPQEMPALNIEERNISKEVELGYTQEQALEEVKRCFECGCSEYYTCKLKELCNEYEIEQKFTGKDFIERPIFNNHPIIKIDNNKCILCNACIKICENTVGAKALKLIKEKTFSYIAPSNGNSLTETNCESCGLCISVCPSGAITENFKFKFGAIKTHSVETISNFESSGEKILLHHRNSYIYKVTGINNEFGIEKNIGRHSKFGYRYFNDKSRITKPLLKKNGEFVEISFEEAYNLVKENVSKVKNIENAFFVGARLTNEEQYLIKKLASDAIKSSNIGSFHYLGRGTGYNENTNFNVKFDQIQNAEKIYILGKDINYNNGLINFYINKTKSKNKCQVILISEESGKYEYKADKIIKIKSYYNFVKAVQAYIIEKELQNQQFIDDKSSGFYEFSDTLSKFNFYAKKAGVGEKAIVEFAEEYIESQNSIIIYEEKEISSNCSIEIQNLSLLTGISEKNNSGIIAIKEKNNSQGLSENNCFNNDILLDGLEISKFKNLFISGEDPIGCAIEKTKTEKMLVTPDFIVVQDYFMTETAKKAHLILPASFPSESGGSYTNTQKVSQSFSAGLKPKTIKTNIEQILGILSKFGKFGLHSLDDVYKEATSKLPVYIEKYIFKYTAEDNKNYMFNYGCDILHKRFEEEFEESFK